MPSNLIFERLLAPPTNFIFDCLDDDLNDFFFHDSFLHQEQLLAVTYMFRANNTNNRIAAYFSVLNDGVKTKPDMKDKMPEGKKYPSYPAVKIGRLGVDKEFRGQKLGSEILSFIKYWFIIKNKTGCKFIIADVYNKPEVIKFYQKNGFTFYTTKDETRETRQMIYDLKAFADRVRQEKL